MNNTSIHSLGFGLASRNARGEIIEVFYPRPLRGPPSNLVKILLEVTGADAGNNAVIDLNRPTLASLVTRLHSDGSAETAALLQKMASGEQPVIACLLARDSKPASVAEVYLKLHLLSHRLALPNSLNLEGAFALLHNLAWTNSGPVPLDELAERQLQARLRGELLEVMAVDKFPKMTNYVVPPGVRIAHSARVRLGAYLGEGTTVMHEGFVNFNAGSAGTAMIEGRISAGVMVGKGSDLGGGCSVMGTLSGGGKEVISVGENCLIGANAGIGFSLGNRCIVEAGLYVTAGTKVNMLDRAGLLQTTVKARDLSGKDDLLLRRNSLTGAVECVPNKTAVELNTALHSNN
ncbi:MAG: 2,3,4,5-tetrahydropyridine-2,6-dicarboxylate N-succinyltransferase [Pseudohongiellaceae bacterium]